MHQATLFDLALIAPSRGEARAARAAKLREERKARARKKRIDPFSQTHDPRSTRTRAAERDVLP
jgi:hypothetical protein